MASRPRLTPFAFETAVQKARAAEDGWHTRDLPMVSMTFSAGSAWRNRKMVIKGSELGESGL